MHKSHARVLISQQQQIVDLQKELQTSRDEHDQQILALQRELQKSQEENEHLLERLHHSERTAQLALQAQKVLD